MDLIHQQPQSTRNRHLVGVYGTLRLGGSNHKKYMSNAIYVKNHKVKGILLDVRDAYPAAVLADRVEESCAAKTFVDSYEFIVEIYDIGQPELDELDMLEGHPNYYQRTLVPVEGMGHIWVYNMHPSWMLHGDQKMFPSGDWINGSNTMMPVKFGDGTEKPSVVVLSAVPQTTSTTVHPNSHMYDDDEDDYDDMGYPWNWSKNKTTTSVPAQSDILKIDTTTKIKEA